MTLTVTAVNDAPTATNLSAAETYTEDTALNLIDIVASDVDSANITATLTLSNVAAGSLNTATSGAVTSTYIAGTGVWTASGAIANVNTLLAGVTFTPALNFNSNFTIATSVSDGVAPAITGVKAMTGTPVNDAPVVDLNAGGAGNNVTTAFTEQTPVLIAPVGTLSDVDSATLSSLLVTLTARPDGNAVESLSLNAAATTAASGAGVDGELYGRDGGALDHGLGHDGGVSVDPAGHSVQRHEQHADYEQPDDQRGGERWGRQ